jgi:hypothetical protein
MKTISKAECPNCGSNSMVSHDEITSECLECRELFHRTQPGEALTGPPRVLKHTERFIILSHFTVCGHRSERVEIEKTTYSKGGVALQLWDEDGPLMTATSWVPRVPANCVAIKTYAENEGCLEQLQQAGVIAPPHSYRSGLPICQLLL